MFKNAITSLFSLVLILMLVTVMVTTSVEVVYGMTSDAYVSMEQATEEANKLNSLGLFLGSNTGYDLDKAPTRTEGLVMLIRMMGEETAAKNCTYNNPFKDVPSWATKYTAWGYAKMYTSGTSATTFSPNTNITAVQYLTFMLRALGYGSETTLQNAVAKATEIGLIPANTYVDEKVPFLRADMVHISYLALQTKDKTTGTPLYEILIEKNAIDEAKALAMFKPETAPEDEKETGENPITADDIRDYLGYGSNEGNPSGGSTAGQSNTPAKLYSYTNTNNNMSSYTISIEGNQVKITGIETTGITWVSLNLYEVKTVASAGGENKNEKVLYKDIILSSTRFSGSITLPELKYGNYFELVVTAGNDTLSGRAFEEVWIKGTKDAWYFEGPVKIASNTTLMQAADSVPMDNWFKFRTNAAKETFKTKVFDLVGPPAATDYETAYKVYNWVIDYVTYANKSEADSLWVLENKTAECGGYANLLADALAAYGIPSRVVYGETLLGITRADSFASPSNITHAWVEFYDSATDTWIVCDPTMGDLIPIFCFDMNRTYVANVMKVVRYK